MLSLIKTPSVATVLGSGFLLEAVTIFHNVL